MPNDGGRAERRKRDRERGPHVLGGVNFKATLERVRATHTRRGMYIDCRRCRVTEGDGDTVKRGPRNRLIAEGTARGGEHRVQEGPLRMRAS